MSSITSDDWNNAVAYLETMVGGPGGTGLSSGSGFFWRLGQRVYLITNWHNLSGRNPLDGQPMHPSGALPDTMKFLVAKQMGAPDVHGLFRMDYLWVECQLFDANGQPTWREHGVFGRRVDVAAFDVTSALMGTLAKMANELESDALLDLQASQDTFIVGYPFGRVADSPAPIWKRGTIAMDPNFDPEGLPKIFIDTATRPGMSGSVAIARHILTARGYTKKDGTDVAPVLYARLETIAGVYSGRIYPDLEQAQLGIIWKRRTIEEVIAGRIAHVALTDP